eukprot:716879-Rhodomonas_salina.1
MSGTDIRYLLHTCYAVSGTDIRYLPHTCSAMSGTDTRYLLRVRYAMSSTDKWMSGTGFGYLRECCALSGTEIR